MAFIIKNSFNFYTCFLFSERVFNWIEQLLIGTFIVAIVILTIRQIQINRQIKKAQQESGKKWMFEM